MTGAGGEDLFARLCSNSKLERDRAEAELARAVTEREELVVQAVSDAATALQDGKPRLCPSSVPPSINSWYHFSLQTELGREAGLPEG